jgi:anti-anti-sigma regulatory factor
VTLPARLDAAAADQAAGQITAALTPGVSVVIADLTAAASCDGSAIRNLLKAHRRATARGGQALCDPPGRPLHQITGFTGIHPLLAVYPTLQHALTGRSPTLPSNRAASRRPGSARCHLWRVRRAAAPAAMTTSRTIRTRGQMAHARRCEITKET